MENERFDIAKVVVLSGWSLTLLACLTVIGAAVYSLAVHRSIDPALEKWATLCFGFLFGSISALVKDFISPRAAGA
jgi:hypothetical protein